MSCYKVTRCGHICRNETLILTECLAETKFTTTQVHIFVCNKHNKLNLLISKVLNHKLLTIHQQLTFFPPLNTMSTAEYVLPWGLVLIGGSPGVAPNANELCMSKARDLRLNCIVNENYVLKFIESQVISDSVI